MVNHAGNAINALTLEEHDGTNNAKRVNVVAGGVGQATVTPVGLHTLAPSPNFIGLVTIAGISTITLSDPKGYIGLVTVGGIGTLTLADPKGFIGLVTIGGIGTLTLSDPKGFIGLVTTVASGNTTVLSRNAGTNKTLQIFPTPLSTASILTVYTPTNKFYVTSLLLNTNATVRVNIRSGVTYLTGNVSLGINLNPGSGFVEMGSPDSPVYLGLANAAALTLEKADSSGVIAQISGKVVLFEE